MMTYKIVLGITLFLTALITGLFYSYSCSVNPGLGRLNDEGYLQSMQHINRAILNPLFFASFMGTLFIFPVCTWVVYRHQGTSIVFWLILVAALLYIVGTFGVTMSRNVPLNNMLDQIDIAGSTAEQLRTKREQFEIPWNRWHGLRTVAVTLSLICTIVAGLWRD